MVTSAKVSIYNQYDELIENGRVCLSIWTNDWTFADIRDYKKLPDNVDLADIVYALSKTGQKVKITIVGQNGETVFDATLKSDERLKNIKYVQNLEEAEKRKAEEEKKRIRDEEERMKPVREAEKEKQRRLARLDKKMKDIEKMIEVSQKNGYAGALKKYKADLEKVLKEIEEEKSKTMAEMLLEKYGASTK